MSALNIAQFQIYNYAKWSNTLLGPNANRKKKKYCYLG